MLRLVLLALLPLLAAAQTRDFDLARTARNPYALARFINSNATFEWGPLWRALGTESVELQPCRKPPNQWTCSAEVIPVTEPEQVILLLNAGLYPMHPYLRYLRNADGTWHFTGQQATFNQFHQASHKLDRSSGTPYLRVSRDWNHGSNIDSEGESWFDLSGPGFPEVFSFPVRGYLQGFQLEISRRFSASFVPLKDEIRVHLEVHFWGQWSLDLPKPGLGTVVSEAVYRRTSGATAFRLDSVVATPPPIGDTDFESVLNLFDGASKEDIVRYNWSNLKGIASGPPNATRAWLKQALRLLKNTPEVAELRSLTR